GALWPCDFLEGRWKPGINIRIKNQLEENDFVNFDRGYFKKCVYENSSFWRPIVYGVLTFTEASIIDPHELMEANTALDRMIKEQNKK
ncbi:MAG: hypothetical protein PHX78_12470, partial [bacterium]|nr:hypothetical protein [bacterium]